MKVYLFDGSEYRWIGRAEVPDDGSPVYDMRLFGAASFIVERFTIGTVTHLPTGGALPIVERGIILSPGQRPEILPRWQPLAS